MSLLGCCTASKTWNADDASRNANPLAGFSTVPGDPGESRGDYRRLATTQACSSIESNVAMPMPTPEFPVSKPPPLRQRRKSLLIRSGFNGKKTASAEPPTNRNTPLTGLCHSAAE